MTINMDNIILIDDGTLDTVFYYAGKQYRYDQEIALEYRNFAGILNAHKMINDIVVDDITEEDIRQ